LFPQLHYLDDFLFFTPPSSPEAHGLHTSVTNICQQLGVPVASHKTEGPSTCLTFLGIVIDTDRMELRLPTEKLLHLRSLLQAWISRHGARRKELESLLGHLGHAAAVISQGRTFLRDLFACLRVAHSPHHHFRLTREARADLLWCTCFLQDWNG
jgi:hypothetical protein